MSQSTRLGQWLFDPRTGRSYRYRDFISTEIESASGEHSSGVPRSLGGNEAYPSAPSTGVTGSDLEISAVAASPPGRAHYGLVDATSTTSRVHAGGFQLGTSPASSNSHAELAAGLGSMRIAHNSSPQNASSIVQATDNRSGVRTSVVRGPASSGRHQAVLPDPYAHSGARLPFSEYRRQSSEFFMVGRVFVMLWVEPVGTTVLSNIRPSNSAESPIDLQGERTKAKARIWVVVREEATYCSALPIRTYSGRGVASGNVTKSDHAIIHTSPIAPEPEQAELSSRNEHGMRDSPIRVVPAAGMGLDRMARVDFAKVTSINHAIRAKALGKVHEHSMAALLTQFNNVLFPAGDPNDSSSSESSPESSDGDDDAQEASNNEDAAQRRATVALQQRVIVLVQGARANRVRLTSEGYTREQATDNGSRRTSAAASNPPGAGRPVAWAEPAVILPLVQGIGSVGYRQDVQYPGNTRSHCRRVRIFQSLPTCSRPFHGHFSLLSVAESGSARQREQITSVFRSMDNFNVHGEDLATT